MQRQFDDWLELSALQAGTCELGGMIVKSVRFQHVAKTIVRLSPYKSTVLIHGESGTGKDLVAQALHQLGPCSDGPFVTFNCSNLVESLAESQLFGHARGAFTDARDEAPGYFRSADGGTLFLDEIGELPLTLQPKLLRAVETHEVQPVGSTRSFRVNIRLIVATNRNLRAMVAAGEFRADLYYRLNAAAIEVPPLRERGDAVGALAAHFIETNNRETGKNIRYISSRALSALRQYEWPGNIREFRHAIESAVMMAESDHLDCNHFPAHLTSSEVDREAAPDSGEAETPDISGISESKNLHPPVSYALDDAIKAALVRALREANGNCHVAAKLLGISRYTVYRMMTRYALGQVRNYRDDTFEGFRRSTG